MARLSYSAITSLDGYVADEDGNFDWAAPDAAVHAFVNDRERPIGTYLYGRRMYEVMRVWETIGRDTDPDEQSAETLDYARLWRAAGKVVYSSTLDTVSTAQTKLVRGFDADAVRETKQSADRDLSIGGPGLAAHAFAAGLVDDVGLFLNPIVVGAGTPALPAGTVVQLDLVDDHRFANGVVYLQYRVRH